jgi:exodeoxyribonuclease VII small subunit
MSDQSDNPSAESFKVHYRTLRDIAQQLNNPGELDIDQLVPLVERATAAYKACRERIEQVEKLLEEQLGTADGGDKS